MNRFKVGFAIVACAIVPIQQAMAASPAEIWIGWSPDEYRAQQGWPAGNGDQAFAHPEQWTTALSRITEYRMTGIFSRSDADIALSAPFFRSHPSVKIALQIAPLDESTLNGKTCGHAVESYNPAAVTMDGVKNIKAAGLTLDAVVMDEPVQFGHFPVAGGCQYPLATIAKMAVARLRLIQTVFPNVRFGEVEPQDETLTQQTVWKEWFADLQTAGQKLDFLQLDVVWRTGPVKRPAVSRNIASAAQIVHAANINLGIDFKGSAAATSDAAWAAQVVANWQQTNAIVGLAYEQAVFESWTLRPVAIVPENVASSLTADVVNWETHH